MTMSKHSCIHNHHTTHTGTSKIVHVPARKRRFNLFLSSYILGFSFGFVTFDVDCVPE